MDLLAYPILRRFLSALGTKPVMAGKGYPFTMGALRVWAFIAGKAAQRVATT